jgi:hypothetical protein
MKAVLIAAGFAAVATMCIVGFGIDISAARYFRGDVIVRDAWPPAAIEPSPFYDPAPWAIWIPSDQFVRSIVLREHLPLWDRLQGGGYSPVLTLQNGVFHPLRWMLAIVPRIDAPSVFLVWIETIAFTGMWLLLRRGIGLSVGATLVGTVLYVSSAACLSFVQFSGAALPLAHLPWVVLAQIAVERRRTFGWFAALTIAIALLLLSGHPLLISVVIAVVGGIAFVLAIDAWSVRPIVVLAASGGFAALLTAFALWPSVAARGELWSYKTSSYAGGVYAPFPDFEEWLRAAAAILIDRHRFGADGFQFSLYTGAAALALAFAGLLAALTTRPGAALFFVAAIAAAMAVPGPWLLEISELRPLRYMNRWYLSPSLAFFVAIFAALGLEALRMQKPLLRRAGIVVAIAAVATCLGLVPTVVTPEHVSDPVRGRAVDFLRAEASRYRITGFTGETHLPNASQTTGIEDARISAPILTQRTHLWWLAIDPHNRRFAFPTTRVTDRLDSALVADFNVKYVLESRLLHDTMHNIQGPRDLAKSALIAKLPLALRLPSLDIRSIPAPRPRAHFAANVVFARTAAVAEKMLERDRTLAAHIAVVESPPIALPANAQGDVVVHYGDDDSRVALDCQSPAGGLVVLHDSFDTGWRATVDGRAATILPVNILSRGVVVGPGTHRIEMRYSPPGFRAGAIVSGAALLLLVVLLLGVDLPHVRLVGTSGDDVVD